MISTIDEAIAFVHQSKIVTLTSVSGFPSLISEIVGKPIRGSWWSHPQGNLIYMISEGLADSLEILTVKLVYGKVSYVHKTLWTALYRVVTDIAWRNKRIASLNSIEKRLLMEVEDREVVRINELITEWPSTSKAQKKEITKARKQLESSLLVYSHQFHSEKGSHSTEIKLWENWVSEATKSSASKLSLNTAIDLLRKACNNEKLAIFK
ncbi:MAG: hypothetical protein IH840_05935 [Candidatus Heimdallarchaeota archaeon]|nr:hypothetical protein [Candidatus Heimdallarchaeota archaeon]